MTMKYIIWLLLVYTCCVVGQTTPSTTGVTVTQVTGSTIATIQPTTASGVNKPSYSTIAALHAVEEDRFHHCTACPFQSDHHQCNDPFMLDKKFEVSADMCNVINADKTQIKRLCKRYPKGYFFQCPKDGSSYTCKASCGVQVEDVGKGLLDADITDMPGGLLSGMGLAGNKVNAHEKHPAFGLLGGMSNLLHPQSHSPLNPFENRQNSNFGQQNQFAVPNPNQFDTPLLHQQVNPRFGNSQQVNPHFGNSQHFRNPDQNQFEIPQHPQQQFRNPQPQYGNQQQQQFRNPQQQQFRDPRQQQFRNPRQQQFRNPRQQQFRDPQQQLNNPQHNSMNDFFGNSQQNHFGEQPNQFAGPHKSYPGHNPLFNEDNNNGFHSQFMDFPQGQFNNGLHHRQPHLMFGNPSSQGQGSGSSFERHPRLVFRNPANLLPPKRPTPPSPINELPTPTETVGTNAQTNAQPNGQPTSVPVRNELLNSETQPTFQPTETTNKPTQAASEPSTADQSENKPSPTASETGDTPRSPIENQVPSKSSQVKNILQARPTPVDNFRAAHPVNVFGNFKPINNPFPSVPRRKPLHPYGGDGFMSQPVQKSVSKATSNLHNFMGGFDDFNDGFHGFASDIGGQGHQRARSSGNQNHFMNNLFGFRRRR